MTTEMLDGELSHLAIEAKTSEEAFGELLEKLKPALGRFVNTYAKNWSVIAERDEIEQWAYIELWNAVRSYDPSGMPFASSWRWVVANHIKARLRSLAYGRAREPHRKAIRFDFVDKDENDETWLSRYKLRLRIPTSMSAEHDFIRADLQQRLHDQLVRTMSSMTELEICCARLVYFEENTYADTQEALGLHSRKPVDNALARVKRKISRDPHLRQLYRELRAL